VVRLSALHTGLLYPQEVLLVLISCYSLSLPQRHNVAKRILCQCKISFTLVCADNQRCVDVCTTGDTAHIGKIFKFLPHTSFNKGALIFFTAAMIRAFYSARSRGKDTARNPRSTVTTDLLCDIPTHKTTSTPPRAANFSLHKIASPSGRNVNYDEKQITGGRKFLRFSISTGLVNTCPMVLL